MTRKDYEAIAAAIRDADREAYDGLYVPDHKTAARVAHCIADVMARDNPRFDRARFLKASGVQS
jgi:hypothetical protein